MVELFSEIHSQFLFHTPLRVTQSPSVDYRYQGMSRPVASPGDRRRRADLHPRVARVRLSVKVVLTVKVIVVNTLQHADRKRDFNERRGSRTAMSTG